MSSRKRPGTARPESARNARLRAEAAARQAETRRRRRRQLVVLLAAGVLVVVGVVGVSLALQNRSRELVVPRTVPAAELTPQVVTPGQPVALGPATAPHTVRVWLDFGCPHCADFATAYDEVLGAAVEEGRARVELMPLTFVDPPSSERAATGFVCAAETGMAGAYHDALFANAGGSGWTEESLVQLAEQVSPGTGPAVAECLQRGQQEYLDSVDQAADAAGVEQTPTVLLDGTALDLATTDPASLEARLQETP
ncbi:DsbA family protein [Desertihabitans brevis]|uniref:DsbA family protein n=1 Tax=Desertihabitans brevis TaxID=2268447 RepID=UPI001314FEF7|nr:thioredoxin domain-containing protein [Desertihabitans brevis]